VSMLLIHGVQEGCPVRLRTQINIRKGPCSVMLKSPRRNYC
jgi:hypothetical protein